MGVSLSKVRCGSAREYFVLHEAGEESGKFSDDERGLHEATLVVLPAVIRREDLSDALSRYEYDAV